MIGAIFKIMWLRLWRDKGALVLAFILPGFIFAIFAAIFSNASGGNLDLRISMAITDTSPSTLAFGKSLEDTADFTLSTDPSWTLDTIKSRVRLGQDDAGFVITGDISNSQTAPIIIVNDPSRAVAATVLMGQVRQALADQSPTQNQVLFTEINALESGAAEGPSDQSVTYYIGATAILFLLFSAMQGASIYLDERKSGIADRLLIGSVGLSAMTFGKFLFLTLIGTIQAAIIVGVGHLFFKVPVAGHLFPLTLACCGSAALAAGIALLTASMSGSSAQMNTVSTFIVLLFSALGGSMVPRFMMPDWLQSIGKFTPNNWAIEAFYGILARGQTHIDLVNVWGILFGGAFICVIIATLISHRLMRI